MIALKLLPHPPIPLKVLICIFAMALYGCSGSSDSEPNEIQSDGESAENIVNGNAATSNDAFDTTDMELISNLPVDNVDSESAPVAPEPVVDNADSESALVAPKPVVDNVDSESALVAPEPVQANLELTPVKTFRISWQIKSKTNSYRVFENQNGISGFTDISGELDATTSSFEHRVALYSKINAQYLVQSCNDQGCVDSEPVMVAGSLDNAIGYFKASNTHAGDLYGSAVSLSADGSTLAVGAPLEDSLSTGIDGDQNNDVDRFFSGAVYVFVLSDGLWVQQAYIKASNVAMDDRFGHAVSLSADGNTLAVGAPTIITGVQNNAPASFEGKVYVFDRSGELWQQQASLKASNAESLDHFGQAISLSADGDTLAVGAYAEDSAATGINGDQHDNSANGSGAAYVFVRAGEHWQQQAYLKASNTEEFDRFGWTVSLSANGSTLAVGAHLENSATTGINGDQNDNSSTSSGAVYVYVRNAELWQQQAYLKASNTETLDQFGWVVSLSTDGNTLVVGAYGEGSAATGVDGDQNDNSANGSGAAYVFVRAGDLWQQQAYLKASNTGEFDEFGWSVSLSADGNTLVVGAPQEDSAAIGINGDQNDSSVVPNAGAVYLFIRSGEIWQQQAYLKASNTGSGDRFGVNDISLSRGDRFGSAINLSADGNTLGIGAILENSAASGINGDQSDNSAGRSGAVYLY